MRKSKYPNRKLAEIVAGGKHQLEQYADNFKKHGFYTVDDLMGTQYILEITEKELIGVLCPKIAMAPAKHIIGMLKTMYR